MPSVKVRKPSTKSYSLVTTIPIETVKAMGITEKNLLTWKPMSQNVVIVEKQSSLTIDHTEPFEFVKNPEKQKEAIQTVVALHNFLLKNTTNPELLAEYSKLKKILVMET